jgi:hypothetical protein
VCKEERIDKEDNAWRSPADDEQKVMSLMLKGASNKPHRGHDKERDL